MKQFQKGKVPDLPFKQARKKPIAIKVIQVNEPFEVETKEGLMKGKAGDWLVVGIHGEMYPIDNGIFEKTYDII